MTLTFIQESGLVFIHDVSDNNATVTAILDFKRKMDSTVKGCFNNDTMFLDALKDSFASFLNFQPNKAAEIIAKFVDSKLRNSSKVVEFFMRCSINPLLRINQISSVAKGII
jgi:cullin-4